ncbi:MAG: chorismate pyruvate-lyase family protein [Pseudomonadota bacterium]
MSPSTTIDLATLPPFQRILLMTDGTVTEMLSVYLGEPIKVQKLHQTVGVAECHIPLLDLNTGSRLMRRQILLCGEQSGQAHLFAESLIVPDRLPRRMSDELLASEQPIGTLIVEHRLETFREICRTEKVTAGDRGVHLGCDADDWLISRTYLVFASGSPMMQITEQFPATSFS